MLTASQAVRSPVAAETAMLSRPDPVVPQALDRSAKTEDGPLREAFDAFIGQTFYGQMLKAMRTSLGKPAYFHGGRGEEIFQGQLDQILTEEMSEAGAEQLTGPMFELFNLHRT